MLAMTAPEPPLEEDYVVADHFLEVVDDVGRPVARCFYGLPRKGPFNQQVYYILRTWAGETEVFDVHYPWNTDLKEVGVTWYEYGGDPYRSDDIGFCCMVLPFDPADTRSTLFGVMREFVVAYFQRERGMVVRTRVSSRKEL